MKILNEKKDYWLTIILLKISSFQQSIW
jgi:hypothetical protein